MTTTKYKGNPEHKIKGGDECYCKECKEISTKCKNCGHEIAKNYNERYIHAVGMSKQCFYLTNERCPCTNPEPQN